MRDVAPRHRYDAVVTAVKARTPPAGGRELALYQVITRQPSPDPVAAYAYDLFQDAQHRAILDAFILAEAGLGTTSRVLNIPSDVLEFYVDMFFDTSVFRNRLEKISYASNYEGDAWASELLRTGVMVGADYLVWTYGGQDKLDTRAVVRHTMIDAFFRGMSHKGNSLTSGVAKEAQKWWATAIKNAEILEKMDPQAAKQAYEELRIALQGTDTTIPAEKAPVPLDDILH